MGVNTFQYGDDQEVFIRLQSAFGTALKPTASHAFRAMAATFGQPVDFQEVNDRRKTRDLMEEKQGRTPLQPWSVSTLFRPSGTLGIAPDIGDLLKLAFGTETVVASTSVTYSLLQDVTALYATVMRELSTTQEGVYDAVCQRVEIRWTGDGFVMFTFSGVASQFIDGSESPASGSGSGVSALVVDDADFFTKYSVIQNVTGTDDNSGAGYQVTAVDYDTNTLTLETTASWSDNDVWRSFLPAGTYVGDPIYGTEVTLSLDNGATTVGHLGGSITIDTGVDLYNREAGTSQANDVVLAGRRRVSGSFDFTVKEAETYIDSHARRGVAKDVLVTIGSSSGERMKVNMNNVRLVPGQRTSPETGPAERSLSFVARGTNGEDSIALVMD